MNIEKVLVIGGGESGVGAALLAKKKNYQVFLSDRGKLKSEHREELINHNIPFEEEGHNIEKLIGFGFDIIVKSPGVPNHAPVFSMLNIEDRDIISEIEFGSIHYSGKIIAVTGSNGKTTTSGLIFHILNSAGLDVGLGGNYGISFCRILTEREPQVMVLEMSSFQLDDVKSFRPFVAVILNITPDHLDRYDYDINKYAEAKFKITQAQTAKDILILNQDDKIIADILKSKKINAKVIKISKENYLPAIKNQYGGTFSLNLMGRHNAFNSLCAIDVARIFGLSDKVIQEHLLTFKNDSHRLENVAIINDVKYINDSKATNVDSVYYALEAMESPVIWIAGGTDKGNDYNDIIDFVKEKVEILICLGIDNTKLKTAFENIVTVFETQSMTEAVAIAAENAESGATVLLSPACASFDLFKNYVDRGDQFKSAVLKLKE